MFIYQLIRYFSVYIHANSAAKIVASTKLCVYLSSTDRKNHSLLLFQPLMLGNIESKQKSEAL